MANDPIILFHRRAACSGCCACASVCPRGAIQMKADGMGFRYPVIDRDLCIKCGLCKRICSFRKATNSPHPEAVIIRFPEYKAKSQSGGVGYALMRKAIMDGMIVYGAAMDSDFIVRHRRVDSLEGLEPLRLSKYVQSDMNEIPARILNDLKCGRRVLFTGTPCQCAGIGSLCAKYRDKLILLDIICHGVPSPEVWKSFLGWQASKQSERLREVVFRDPSLGWHRSRTLLVFESGKRVHTADFIFLFMENIMSRPSCGVCPFSCPQRPSDLTMGDCWGVEKILPDFADEDGCSLVLLNTSNGRAFFDGIEDTCDKYPVDICQVLQPNLIAPSAPSPFTRCFENSFIRKGFPFVWSRYGYGSLTHKGWALFNKVLSYFHS